MKTWLILIAASTVLGAAAICFSDGPVLDGPLTLAAAVPDTDAAPAPPASSAVPEKCPPVRPAPPAQPSPAPSRVAPDGSAAPRAPGAADSPAGQTSAADARLFERLGAILVELEASGEVSDTSRAEFEAWLEQDPETALAAVRFLFSGLPGGLGPARPFLFQALIDIDQPAVTAEIKRRIDEKRQELLAALPQTPEQTHDALLFGDPAVQRRVVRALKPTDLVDPVVLDYLRTTARNPSASWELRSAAVTALGRVASSESAVWLLGMLATAGQPVERAAVLRALAKHVGVHPGVTQALLDQVFDRGQPLPVRRFAVSGLAGAPPSAEIKNTLLELLKHEPDAHLRRAAISGLRNYREEADLREALRMLRSRESDPEVLAAIAFLLGP